MKQAAAGSVIGVVGFIVLWFIDWRIAVGVFLCIYGNNLHFGAPR